MDSAQATQIPSALIIDDDEPFLRRLAQLVEAEGFTATTATSLRDARSLIHVRCPDVVLVDLFLHDGSGLELAEELQGEESTQVVVVTAHGSIDSAMEAVRKGATDYLIKPLDIPRLKTVLAAVLREQGLREEVDTLRAELRKLGRFGALVGSSAPMQRAYDLIDRVAPTNATVLLTGESGTGKELVAETIHRLSRRRRGEFVAVNCGAISQQLIESELFGHERGSFTGADRVHRGYFERASGGTIFLDEISEMPIELQVKLLRVLETSLVTRVGAEAAIAIDVRVIAATNKSLEQAVSRGAFRDDLMYRLKVFPLHLPPLRERDADVEMLAVHFLKHLNQSEGSAKTLSRAALDRLQAYAWPGNVRQLKNVVHQAFILADGEIRLDCLPADFDQAPVDTKSTLNLQVGLSLDEVDRRIVLATLDACGGDKKRAAEVLGISLKTLYNRLATYRAS